MKFLVLIVFSLMFISCNKSPQPLLIDNPTDQTFRLKFKKLDTIHIGPFQTATIDIPFGKQSLVINGGEPVKMHLDSKKEYILNPSFENYYLQKLEYFTNPSAAKRHNQKVGNIRSQVEQFVIDGDYEKIDSQLLIQKNWNYGLDEDPDMGLKAKRYVGNQSSFTLRKIHRKQDILNSIGEHFLEELNKMSKDSDEE